MCYKQDWTSGFMSGVRKLRTEGGVLLPKRRQIALERSHLYMEKTTRKRGRPRIEVTQDVLEARRLARQRYNARRTEVATNTAAILLKPRSAVSASEFPRRRTNINKKKADFGKCLYM
ncbi:hypothetical protein ACET3Z_024411 [Daucus carota]